MDARRRHAVGTIAIGLAATLALTGCTINLRLPPDDDRQTGSRESSESGGGGPWSSDEFGRRDIMFALMMIPHHQQAVDMSELALDRSSDPDVRALAEQIRDAQSPEIEQMQGWLDKAGAGSLSDRDISDMGMGMGMLDDDELAALENATGSEFDRLWLEGMIEHHEGAIRMTRMIRDSDNPEVRSLAEAIVTSQKAEIDRMKQLLGR